MRYKRKGVLISLMALLFLAGLYVTAYPHLRGSAIDQSVSSQADIFLNRVEALPPEQEKPQTVAIPTEPAEKAQKHQQLWDAMVAYNTSIYANGQTALSAPSAYQTPCFTLADYGLENEIFGVLSIPKLELELPIYLGATAEHLAGGAAQLSQTSVPIGGVNTNCVLAGHRGWYGALFFRHIELLEVGDEIYITNLWQTLTYRVDEIQIIDPNDIDRVLIQPGRDLVTLLTCHPYASGGKQRYVVYCERIEPTITPTT